MKFSVYHRDWNLQIKNKENILQAVSWIKFIKWIVMVSGNILSWATEEK